MKLTILHVRFALSILLTVCIFLGTFGSQLQQTFEDGKSYLYLYKIAGTQAVYFAKAGRDYFVCPRQFNMINTSFAMGIIACLVTLISVVVVVATLVVAPRFVGRGILRAKAALIASIAACVFIVICMIVTSVTFKTLLCDDPLAGIIGEDATYDYGYYFLCISTGLSMVWLGFEIRVGRRGGIDAAEKRHLIA